MFIGITISKKIINFNTFSDLNTEIQLITHKFN